MKLCINCLHCGTTSTGPDCRHPLIATVSPVDGKPRYVWCELPRATGGRCGPDGTLFEPKAREQAA